MNPTAPIQFGTDGVRGPVGHFPIDPAGAAQIGQGIASWSASGKGARVVVGMDSRLSGPDLAVALTQGLVRGGAEVRLAGVLPTAGVSALVAATDADAGVMITASHNPWTDNGIKVLGRDGTKPRDTAGLEAAFHHLKTAPGGKVVVVEAPAAPWRGAMPKPDLTGRCVLLDAAHGAASHLAPAVLEALGARVVRRGCAPDGRNINAGVGAMHPPTAADVQAAGADFAICLDGDADRVLFVDPDRGVLDGDDILWMLSGQVDGPIVGTVMSNGGLEAALAGRLLRSSVGDQNVAALMVSSGARIGAEASGHVLFADGMPTGDGLYAALRVLDTLGSPRRLPAPAWTRWPQVQDAVRFSGPRIELASLSALGVADAAGMRLVVRYSGTEPKLRILVEGPDGDAAAHHCRAIRQQFKRALAARPAVR